MSLDVNKSKFKFVEAMEVRLNAIEDEKTKEVSLQAVRDSQGEVQKNFQALGQAVNSILTSDAEVFSNQAIDANFWNWIQAVNAWFSEAKKQYPNLPEPPTLTAPTQLKGKIQ
jgi:hypothetical protein